MFSLCVQRDFEAQHYLIGGDWGEENAPHTHNYRLELTLEGDTLNHHGFLIDIEEVGRELDGLLATYRGATLNTLPDFEGLNPSLERFARIVCAALARRLRTEQLRAVNVRLWESQDASASYRLEF
ncbi:MAG: 6-carboxytetrahydropterin synthase [Chloroflexi bacterium]|nr:6-carboxytetrahydropterin synthase [Chloroflexota bacterium]